MIKTLRKIFDLEPNCVCGGRHHPKETHVDIISEEYPLDKFLVGEYNPKSHFFDDERYSTDKEVFQCPRCRKMMALDSTRTRKCHCGLHWEANLRCVIVSKHVPPGGSEATTARAQGRTVRSTILNSQNPPSSL